MFPRLQRACFHPPSKLGGIQQAFFIKIEEENHGKILRIPFCEAF
jgi:hypothetical protein